MGLNTLRSLSACIKYFTNSKLKIMIAIILAALLIGCQDTKNSDTESLISSAKKMVSMTQSGHLYNFSAKSLEQLRTDLSHSQQKRVHMIQLGDSHTAADVFTGKIRTILQSKFGDGGIGFIPAADIKGIRSNLVTIETGNPKWEILTSRKEESTIFPLGGYQVNTQNQSGNIKVKARSNYVSKIDSYEMSVLFNSSAKNTILVNRKPLNVQGQNRNWQWSPLVKNLQLPIGIEVNKANHLAIGGIFLASSKQNGLVFSTLGINGATATFWDKWHESWYGSLKALTPNLVILAYGTNEAYDATLDLKQYEKDLSARLQKLQSLLPNTAFLLIGPPDSMKTKGPMASNQCVSEYSAHLTNIINIQKQLAKKHQILFWDWQAAMGGPCSILKWEKQLLAKEDKVHLTAEGYDMSAKFFTRDLLKLLQL